MQSGTQELTSCCQKMPLFKLCHNIEVEFFLNNDHINNTKINNSILKGEKKGTLLVHKGTCTFALVSIKC